MDLWEGSEKGDNNTVGCSDFLLGLGEGKNEGGTSTDSDEGWTVDNEATRFGDLVAGVATCGRVDGTVGNKIWLLVGTTEGTLRTGTWMI